MRVDKWCARLDAAASLHVTSRHGGEGQLIDAPLIRIRIPGDRDAISGLEHDSDVMVDKMTAVRRSNVASRLGRLTSEQLVEVERSMMAFLGLAR